MGSAVRDDSGWVWERNWIPEGFRGGEQRQGAVVDVDDDTRWQTLRDLVRVLRDCYVKSGRGRPAFGPDLTDTICALDLVLEFMAALDRGGGIDLVTSA